MERLLLFVELQDHHRAAVDVPSRVGHVNRLVQLQMENVCRCTADREPHAPLLLDNGHVAARDVDACPGPYRRLDDNVRVSLRPPTRRHSGSEPPGLSPKWDQGASTCAQVKNGVKPASALRTVTQYAHKTATTFLRMGGLLVFVSTPGTQQ